MTQYIQYPVISEPDQDLGSQIGTTSALQYYVASNGSDSLGDGTSGNPYFTIQKAVIQLPKQINHTVTINVGAGTFAGFTLEGFNFNTLGVDALGLYVTGTMGISTLASGVTSGVATGATAGTNDSVTWGTVTIAAAGWTVDDLRGRFVRIDSGTGVGQIRAIASNTATVITVAGNWTAPTGATLSIVEPTTFINGPFNTQVTGTCVYIHGCQGGTEITNFSPDRQAVHISNINFTTGSRGIRVASNIRAKFDNNKFLSSNNGIVAVGAGGRLEVLNSVFNGMPVGLLAEDLSLVIAQRNVFLGCATGFQETSSALTLIGTGSNSVSNMNYYRACTTQAISVNGVMAITGDIIDAVTPGSRIGILSSGTAGFTRISTCNISNCFTAIQVTGAGTSRYVSLIGVVASPTTVFNDGPGAGNTTVILITKGVPVQIAATATLTGTTEINMDGTSTTLAVMRAASPKVIRNQDFGTMVYE